MPSGAVRALSLAVAVALDALLTHMAVRDVQRCRPGLQARPKAFGLLALVVLGALALPTPDLPDRGGQPGLGRLVGGGGLAGLTVVVALLGMLTLSKAPGPVSGAATSWRARTGA
ncbi:hypothetical protein ABZ719_22335 [Streptomyces sp. NPDC006743]|uniref:hypothetical protein n=1 Tax=Streptomyces sp. NPDC006743 TaxID=3154480 RepID=UPI003451C03C